VGGELAGDLGEVGTPELLGSGRQDVVPVGGEAAAYGGQVHRAGQEPHVQVLGAVADPHRVAAGDVRQALHDPADPHGEDPELGRLVLVEIGQVVMLERLEDQHQRQPGLLQVLDPPALVLPDHAWQVGAAQVAVHSVLAAAWLLGGRGSERLGGDLPVAYDPREHVPLGHARCGQLPSGLDPGVDLFSCLGHGSNDATVGGGVTRRS
jgi:hypothetical protein